MVTDVYSGKKKVHSVDGRNSANQLIGSQSHHLQGGGCRISSINSRSGSLDLQEFFHVRGFFLCAN